jgi:hypothetical protein
LLGAKILWVLQGRPNEEDPSRKGMTWEEADWVDEEAVSHRSMDE